MNLTAAQWYENWIADGGPECGHTDDYAADIAATGPANILEFLGDRENEGDDRATVLADAIEDACTALHSMARSDAQAGTWRTSTLHTKTERLRYAQIWEAARRRAGHAV